MTPEENDASLPQTLREAMTERRSLHDQLQLATKSASLRNQDLLAREKQIIRDFALDNPHVAETKEEFLKLHRAFIELVNELAASYRRSSALTKEVPTSKSSWQFLKNRSTPTKALLHEQTIIGSLRSEFGHGVKERASLVDHMEAVLDKMQVLVDSEASI
jgi:hypothetical protein